MGVLPLYIKRLREAILICSLPGRQVKNKNLFTWKGVFCYAQNGRTLSGVPIIFFQKNVKFVHKIYKNRLYDNSD